MKSKAILMALLALAFEAWAVPVSQSQVEVAARAWACAGVSLGAQMGTEVFETHAIDVPNAAAVYAVKLVGGGTVFMSSDSDLEPIVGFTSVSDTDLSEKSPLVCLLRLDAVARRRLAELAALPGQSTALSATSSVGAPQTCARKWEALLAATPSDKTSGSFGTSASSSAKPLSALNDVRIKPLLKTKWNQEEGGGGYCWNYYTPHHIACGCTATAAAQIMRYFSWPTAEMAPASYDCKLEGKTVKYTTKGGFYDWASMPEVLSGGIPQAQREAIGRLAYDIGVTLRTAYSEANGGSADPDRLGTLYRLFKYANGYVFWDGSSYHTGKGGLHEASLRQRLIYANLDAKRPVQLAIYGYPKAHLYDSEHWAGHSVVGDGYGYNVVGDVRTAYVHINMGWGGLDDMWYNIPEIDAANSGAHSGDNGFDFLFMGGAAFNIFTEESGLDILSGRVTDDFGVGVKGAKVTASLTGGEAVQVVTTDANGIYAFELEGGQTYDVTVVSADGKQVDALDGIALRKTVGDSSRIVSDSAKVGNSWGNDMMLTPPDVRIVVGDETKIYSCLDKALSAARAIALGDPTQPVVIEVIDDTELKAGFIVDFPCVVRSVGGRFSVTRVKGAGLSVAPTGKLKLENLTFSTSSTTLVDVAAGGRFVLGADVGLGLSSVEIAAVRTADAAGFVLAAPLEAGFSIDCAKAHGIGASFGAVDGLSVAVAAEAAAKIVNVHDAYGEIRGTVADDGVTLVWGEVPVPLTEAVGYFVGSDGVTNTAARLDRLFPKFRDALNDGTVGAGSELVLQESGSLADMTLVSSCDFTIRGGDTGLVVSNGVAGTMSTSGFVVSNGTLTVKNLTFEGFTGSRPFVTVDGEGARLVLGQGAKLRNLKRVGAGAEGGPVCVKKGALLLAGGAEITGGSSSQNGGGIYLKGTGCSLEISGGAISNCHAVMYGGGVYAGKGASVNLSGRTFVCANASGQSQPYAADDLYLANGGVAALTGLIEGGRIGVRRAGTTAFADGSLAGLALETTAKAFFNDKDGTKVAVPDGSKLVWGDPAPVFEHQPTTDESLAVAKVHLPNGKTELWESMQWALQAISNETGSVTVELLKDDFIADEISVRAKLTLRSAGDKTLSRAPGAGLTVLTEASLTIADLTLKGVHADDDKPSARPLVKAEGGDVILADGAVIEGVLGSGSRDATAVTIWKGTFRMEGDAEIRSCTNLFVNASEGAGCGGAVLVDSDSEAWFLGGHISGNAAYRAGGVAVANRTVIHLGGKISIDGNTTLSGDASDLQIHDKESLFVDETLTGSLGYIEGVGGDKQVFGRFSDSFPGTDADKATSARKFEHDVTGDIGAAVSDGQGTTLLVWSDAVEPDGTFVRDGVQYDYIEGGELLPVAPPTAVPDLTYSKGVEQIGVKPGIGYALDGNAAVDAGTYQATVTLRKGFVWEDGDDQPKTIEWSIAKAVISLDGVTFTGATFVFDGQSHYIRISGSLPDGVKVRYENNDQSAVGIYLVKAIFTAEDADNCVLSVSELTADLVITDQPVPPPPPPPPVPETNDPTPIAFQSIRFDADAGEWELVVTNGVKDCWYSLWGGTELKLNERGLIGTEVVAPAQADADGPVIFRVAVPDTDRQWFWRALAEPGEVRP